MHHHHHRHGGKYKRRHFAHRPSAPGDLGHHHDHPRGHHRRHGSRRSGRLFDHGELRLVVLALVSEQPRHGYEIIKEIEDRTAGAYSPSPGVIYPTLTMLEELGHASVTESGGRKLYAATPDGAALLAASRPALDAALARVHAAGAAGSSAPAPEIIRATENLRLALRLRQDRAPLTGDQVRTIAAALDAAAIAIERS